MPIYLGLQFPTGSSDLPGEGASNSIFPLFGLAPGGVYLADRVAPATGELLPHRFTLTSRRVQRRSTLCCTFRRIAPPGSYPAPLLYGARTFLFATRTKRASGTLLNLLGEPHSLYVSI